MKTPDITPQAIGAFAILMVTNLLLLFGLSIPPSKEAALTTIINGASVVAFLLHDAIVRRSRAKLAAAKAGIEPMALND